RRRVQQHSAQRPGDTPERPAAGAGRPPGPGGPVRDPPARRALEGTRPGAGLPGRGSTLPSPGPGRRGGGCLHDERRVPRVLPALGAADPICSMKIIHIITRLIIGGAQENTLLTVEGLHHRHRDAVTLITGPAEGPEGDLFGRASRLGLKVELMPELV